MIPLQALLNNLTDPQLAFLTYCVEGWDAPEESWNDAFNTAVREMQKIANELYAKRELDANMFAIDNRRSAK